MLGFQTAHVFMFISLAEDLGNVNYDVAEDRIDTEEIEFVDASPPILALQPPGSEVPDNVFIVPVSETTFYQEIPSIRDYNTEPIILTPYADKQHTDTTISTPQPNIGDIKKHDEVNSKVDEEEGGEAKKEVLGIDNFFHELSPKETILKPLIYNSETHEPTVISSSHASKQDAMLEPSSNNHTHSHELKTDTSVDTYKTGEVVRPTAPHLEPKEKLNPDTNLGIEDFFGQLADVTNIEEENSKDDKMTVDKENDTGLRDVDSKFPDKLSDADMVSVTGDSDTEQMRDMAELRQATHKASGHINITKDYQEGSSLIIGQLEDPHADELEDELVENTIENNDNITSAPLVMSVNQSNMNGSAITNNEYNSSADQTLSQILVANNHNSMVFNTTTHTEEVKIRREKGMDKEIDENDDIFSKENRVADDENIFTIGKEDKIMDVSKDEQEGKGSKDILIFKTPERLDSNSSTTEEIFLGRNSSAIYSTVSKLDNENIFDATTSSTISGNEKVVHAMDDITNSTALDEAAEQSITLNKTKNSTESVSDVPPVTSNDDMEKKEILSTIQNFVEETTMFTLSDEQIPRRGNKTENINVSIEDITEEEVTTMFPKEELSTTRRLPEKYIRTRAKPPTTTPTPPKIINHNMNLQTALIINTLSKVTLITYKLYSFINSLHLLGFTKCTTIKT